MWGAPRKPAVINLAPQAWLETGLTLNYLLSTHYEEGDI